MILVIVADTQTWGKAETKEAALKKAASQTNTRRKPKNYTVYEVHPDTYMTDDACLVSPAGEENRPVVVERVRGGKIVQNIS